MWISSPGGSPDRVLVRTNLDTGVASPTHTRDSQEVMSCDAQTAAQPIKDTEAWRCVPADTFSRTKTLVNTITQARSDLTHTHTHQKHEQRAMRELRVVIVTTQHPTALTHKH